MSCSFDVRVLRNRFEQVGFGLPQHWKTFCTCEYANYVDELRNWPRRGGAEDMKLGTLEQDFGVVRAGQPHRCGAMLGHTQLGSWGPHSQ